MLQSWLFWDKVHFVHWDGQSHTGYFTFYNPPVIAAVNISLYKKFHQNLNCAKCLTLLSTGTYGNYIYCNVFPFHKTVKHGKWGLYTVNT